jgi:hypothetical protein
VIPDSGHLISEIEQKVLDPNARGG